MLKINSTPENNKAKEFCKAFLESKRPKYIFGRNDWAKSVTNIIDVDGFIDEFTHDKEYLDKPIVPIEDIPNNAMVVSIVQGKPFVAEKSMRRFQFDSLDYYAFFKYSNLPIKQVMFWEGMTEDIKINFSKYNWIYTLLKDKTSKNQFFNIINFRISYDLDYMRGFKNIEDKQYFEDFLQLNPNGESFADIGAFDGYTTKEFIKRCPNYKKVFLFEPEEKNMETAKNELMSAYNIQFFKLGLSDKKETLRFDVSGSSSKISENGALTIHVDKLDDLINEEVTFIKMDIEGYEQRAIKGAKKIIQKYHPRLAISVYHKKDDFWKIPKLILNIRNDYNIYLRHYTEGISETIMFFIPYTKTDT
ncbi:FkbM family methyltransferase [Sulfurovum sp. ST-21]|uniref:FkbM family methyltransferase n=1 Tax=Sulfurovum indicum TaxID=2779528 RepID=A0A7M1S4F9_9BACT|nr:FkbM family methyltransferase [Sulfurovum indicum]QOR62206.1 FkbM family methyltransferase [Sulfurovum indicum]